jgi:hypothetical protein
VGRGCADDNTPSIFVGLRGADENTTFIFVGLNAADENRRPKSSRSRARTFSLPLAPFSVLSAAARRTPSVARAVACPRCSSRAPSPDLVVRHALTTALSCPRLPSPPHCPSSPALARSPPARARRPRALDAARSYTRLPSPPHSPSLASPRRRVRPPALAIAPRLPSSSVARARSSTPSSTVHAVRRVCPPSVHAELRRARPPSVHAELRRARLPSVHDALVPRGEPPRLPSSPSVLYSEFVFGARCFGIRPSGLCQVAGGGTWLRPVTWR